MKKIAVLFHGYPSPVGRDMPLWIFLEKSGYEVLMPRYLETSEEFSCQWMVYETNRLLKGRTPDLLIGLSLGGMVLPYVAVKYPKAKIIFAATGGRLKPKYKWFNLIIDMASGRSGRWIAEWLPRIPKKVIAVGYDVFHKPSDMVVQEFCDKDKQVIIHTFRNTTPDKHVEIARFVRSTDTRAILRKICNKTLVCVGNADELMPPEVGEELASLIKGSRLVRVNAQHFDVMNDEVFKEMKKFIRT